MSSCVVAIVASPFCHHCLQRLLPLGHWVDRAPLTATAVVDPLRGEATPQLAATLATELVGSPPCLNRLLKRSRSDKAT